MAIKQITVSHLYWPQACRRMGQRDFVVQDIKIEGLQRVALGAALLKMPVRIGDTKLMVTGCFRDHPSALYQFR